ncbi:MAG: ATP-binding cassette domain-containing protein [Candidatus Omnitrophica bacterium]|nr:ATP-binding cassette domain-containing protein [Candidatus Omnitrophota bacterium]MCM8791497.1 ATP-binding cassette domain-containing protein [Candidatus Omnitrophota bacterium]
MKKIVEFKGASLCYGRRTVVGNLNFDIHDNDFLGVVGPNGSGKTTFLRAVMGLIKPKSGKVITAPGLRFGYCMQRQFIDTLFPFTVFDIVMMARASVKGSFRPTDESDRRKVFESLEIAGIPELASSAFRDLSGGQKQRVLIARALSFEPNFLILDEPTTDLDVKGEREILKLISSLHSEKALTVVLVSHELNEVINFSDKFLFLTGQGRWWTISKEDLSASILSDIFGVKMDLKKIDGKYVTA